MTEYPPYVDAYGQLKDLFDKIKEAAVPPKFNRDFLQNILGLKSSSFQPMIPFLKKLNFIDEANVPTTNYTAYRDDTQSEGIMADQIKQAYSTIFSASEYAYTLSKDQLISKLNTILGTPKDDKNVIKVAATFLELVKLADFKINKNNPKKVDVKKLEEEKIIPPFNSPEPSIMGNGQRLGISYTINLNLPATPDVEVFNAIFKSIKEHLLK